MTRRDRLLAASAILSGLLPVASAVAAHAASYPVSPVRAVLVAVAAAAYSCAVCAIACHLAGSVAVGAAVAMIWALVAYCYPLVVTLARTRLSAEEPFALGYVVLALLTCLALLKRGRVDNGVPLVLSTVVLVLLGSAIAVAVPPYLRAAPFHVLDASATTLPARQPARPLPNIYHLVLDGLGRTDVLQARYGVDLGGVVSALTQDGFSVEGGAVANYAQTYLSVASMLNAEYVHVPAGRAQAHSRQPLYDAIQHNAVFSILRRAGYDVLFLASDYSATEHAALATTCRCPPTLFGEFESSVVYRTPFRALWPGTLDYLPHRRRIAETLDGFTASARAGRRKPQYTFAHVLSPHPPFILQADGTFAPPRRAFSFFDGTMYPGDAAEYRAGYARQVQYLMRRVVDIAARLRARDPGAVVIVSGDHGPRLRFSASDARRTDVQEVSPIFLAVRWGDRASGAPVVESPVNLYREILRRYLGTAMPPLPDRVYVSSFATPYEFVEVDRRTLVSIPPLAASASR